MHDDPGELLETVRRRYAQILEEVHKVIVGQEAVVRNVTLADEINRTPPKTQPALLEAMQEYAVPVAGRTMPIEPPFFVVATQNPIEQEGTYPLPEAQLDRFMYSLYVDYPSTAEE